MKAKPGMCAAVRTQLVSLDGPEQLAGPLASHASKCLKCQAEMARYHRMQRGLRHMADEQTAAPLDLVESVESAIDRAAADGNQASLPLPVRVAAAAGALAAAAGTIAVIGWMRARSAA